MRRLIGILVCAMTACGAPNPSAPESSGGPPVCEEGPATPAATVERKRAVLGPSLNAIRRTDDALWIVESGSNTVTRFDLSTQTTDTFVDVGNERSPWDVWVGPDKIWITNYLADTVTVADRETGAVLDELSDAAFDGPAGITGTDRYVYVGNVQFRGENEYGPGSVTILDRDTGEVLGTRDTARKNPQFLATVTTSIGVRVAVVDSGAIQFDERGARAGSDAAVELWRETDDPLSPERVVLNLPLTDGGIGTPGFPAHRDGSDRIYLASGTSPHVFELDARKGTWLHGEEDPIELPHTEGDSLNHAAIDERGVLYVTSFNEDALYLLDTSCDAMLGDPIDLEPSEMLGGPHGVVPVARDGGVDAWYAMSLANELGRVRLDFTR